MSHTNLISTLRAPTRSALSAVARRGISSTAPAATTKHPFSFLPANSLSPKPRKTGLTEIRGPYYAPVTQTYLDELLSDWGEYVDGIKFAGGAFSLMPKDRLQGLIDVCHKHGALPQVPLTPLTHLCADCYVSTGGYIERVLATSPGTSSSQVSKYLTTCKNMGFDVLELSSGFLSLPTEDWALLVEDTRKAGLKPKPEVGIQYVSYFLRLCEQNVEDTIDGAQAEMLPSQSSSQPERETPSGSLTVPMSSYKLAPTYVRTFAYKYDSHNTLH